MKNKFIQNLMLQFVFLSGYTVLIIACLALQKKSTTLFPWLFDWIADAPIIELWEVVGIIAIILFVISYLLVKFNKTVVPF